MRRISAVVLVIASAACARRVPDVLATVPDFRMTSVEAKGESPFGRERMLGRVWIVDFIYTSCAGPCPLMTESMARLSRELPEGVGFISVSVDPEGDTPARLREYARAHAAGSARWLFLRGGGEETYRLAFAGFRMPFSADPKSPAALRVTHGMRFILVDARGGIRGYYDGLSDAGLEALSRDARRLLEAGS